MEGASSQGAMFGGFKDTMEASVACLLCFRLSPPVKVVIHAMCPLVYLFPFFLGEKISFTPKAMNR